MKYFVTNKSGVVIAMFRTSVSAWIYIHAIDPLCNTHDLWYAGAKGDKLITR